MTSPISPDVQLSAEEVAVTDVLLRVHIADGISHDSIRVSRNDVSILTLAFRGSDTLVTDAHLLPKQSYAYKLYSFCMNTANFSSETLALTTMDMTSQEFTWKIDTLGDG